MSLTDDSAEPCAAIDLGSNLIRLAIGHRGPSGSPPVLHKFVGVARIAEGLGDRQAIEPPAVARAIDVLTGLMVEGGVSARHVRAAVATGALRLADNRDEVIERIHRATGVAFEVITGAREAALSARGVRSQSNATEMTVLDIGGTTTEVVVSRGRVPELTRSFDIGVITLTERAARATDPDAEFAARTEAAFRDLTPPVPRPCFAAGGAAVALMTLRDGESFLQFIGDGRQVIRKEERREVFERFLRWTPEERARRLGVTVEHAALVPAGYAILEALTARLDIDAVIPTGRGVVEGLLYESLERGEPPAATPERTDPSIG